MKRTYSHIDMDERRKIARWRTAGLSIELIAEKLGRHRSTIFREIRRNTFTDAEFVDLNGYYCVTAHDMACERRAKLRKLSRFSNVRQSVIDRIMHGWSPQQIAGRMRLERHPVSVSHETIYKFAYSADGQAIKLWRHLPEHRARRRPRHAMPDASMVNGLAQNSTFCAAPTLSLPGSSSGTGNAISSSFERSLGKPM